MVDLTVCTRAPAHLTRVKASRMPRGTSAISPGAGNLVAQAAIPLPTRIGCRGPGVKMAQAD